MIDAVVGVLAWLQGFSEPLAWVVVAAFLAGTGLERYDREYARYLFVGAWVLFGLFWLTMIHYFGIEQKSIVEGIGTVVAVPASVYVAVLLARGRDSLFTLSRAVAVMGLFYMPLVSVPAVRRPLIELVTDQTAWVMALLGFEPTVVSGMTVDGLRIADKIYPYESTFVYYEGGTPITYTVRIACTGIGSMAIIAGIVAAVRAPATRKAAALAVSLPVIYVLNIVRNVFISLSLGKQAFHVFPEVVATAFSLGDPRLVSYIVADRIIAQSLSVVALVVILWLVVQRLPEVLTVVEDAVYLFTGREYDLGDAVGAPRFD
ncbi:MAG: archaeosortase A [Halobacteriales archaeon]